MGKGAWKKFSADELEAAVEKHNRLYFEKHSPEISDYEFDQMVEELRRRRPGASVLANIPSDVAPRGAKVRHEVPMLSLDKCYDEKSLASWAEKFEGDVVASPKIDGCAVCIRYDAKGRLALAATRGDGVEGEDVTANAREVGGIPHAIDLRSVEVRGEIYMPLSVFARYSREFANPRNLAAGAIKQKDAKRTRAYALSFFAYDLIGGGAGREAEKYRLLAREGFAVVEWKEIGRDQMQSAFEEYLKRRTEFDFETDGVVYKVNSVDEQLRLGVTAHHPRYAIAYKFQGDSGETALIDVEWSVARTGAITPVAIVEPVELSGAFVSRASLHNVGIMKRLGITLGAKVLMMRRGGVIPNLESVLEKGKGSIEIPGHCPSCGEPTKLDGDFLYCTRPKTCVQSKIGELEHFVKSAGIDGFGEKLILQLYQSGVVTDPADFYDLTKDELLEMERMGETLAEKLLANIESKRTISLDLFLQSLGIRELGRQASALLAGIGPLDELMSLGEDKLSEIHTIGPVIAHEVVAGFKAKKRLIDKLLKHVKIARVETKKSGPLSGKSFLFTGSLIAMERSEAQGRVEKLGGSAAQSVTKDLDYLVVGDGGGAGSKLSKAKKLATNGNKIKIISEKEFLTIVNY